jgi:hypothetical protein
VGALVACPLLGEAGMNAWRVLLVGGVVLAGCPGDDETVPDGPLAPDAQVDASFQDWTLEDPGPGGFQFLIPEFDVPQGVETQRCYFIEVPDLNGGQPIDISRFKTAINPGSHHMNVFRVKTIVNLDGAPGTSVIDGECFKSPNWADWPLVVNSQNSLVNDPYTDWQLPANVAAKFLPGEKLMVQVHYVNASSQETPFKARAGINFYKSPDASPMELGTLFATQQSIRVCQSNPTPSYSGACSIGSATPVTIIAANGHFHSRGKEFRMYAWDGVSITEPPATEMFYESPAWDEPVMLRDIDVTTVPSGGVWWTCDFQWMQPQAPATCDELNMKDPQMANDCCYTFGPKVETSEHCNAFVYYYPKQDDVNCN